VTGTLISVNVGPLRDAPYAHRTGRTSIDRRPVVGRIAVGRGGITGDEHSDLSVHGGQDQAVYAYAREDARWWAEQLGRDVPPGNVGENLTTSDVDVTGALIGERWAIGSALLQVVGARIPCRTFAGFWGVPDLIKRFTERATPGAYLRVLVEGEIGAGDAIEVVHRPDHDLTVGATFRALTTEPDQLPRLLEVPELAAKWSENARRRVNALEAS
jgi:MOSC domain-containing protein YiiM